MVALEGYEERTSEPRVIGGSSITIPIHLPAEKSNCPACGKTEVESKGERKMLIHDVPFGLQRRKFLIFRKRYKCRDTKDCGIYFTQNLPLVSETHRMTDRLVDYIEQIASSKNSSDVADTVGVDSKTVTAVFSKHADAVLGEIMIKTPRVMGIDEIRLGKGRTCAVIVNIETGTLVELLPDRRADTVRRYLQNLPDRETVKAVLMDQHESYRSAVEKTLCCCIVLDRFHAVAAAQNSMERVRKAFRQFEGKNISRLMRGDIALLKMNPENLDEANKGQITQLNTILEVDPNLRRCYECLCKYRNIWKAENVDEADRRMGEWLRDLGTMKSVFKRPHELLVNWRAEILAYFVSKHTNALSESMIGRIRKMYSASNGCSFKVLRRKVLLTYGIRRTPKQSNPETESSYNNKDGFDPYDEYRLRCSWYMDADLYDEFSEFRTRTSGYKSQNNNSFEFMDLYG